MVQRRGGCCGGLCVEAGPCGASWGGAGRGGRGEARRRRGPLEVALISLTSPLAIHHTLAGVSSHHVITYELDLHTCSLRSMKSHCSRIFWSLCKICHLSNLYLVLK